MTRLTEPDMVKLCAAVAHLVERVLDEGDMDDESRALLGVLYRTMNQATAQLTEVA